MTTADVASRAHFRQRHRPMTEKRERSGTNGSCAFAPTTEAGGNDWASLSWVCRFPRPDRAGGCRTRDDRRAGYDAAGADRQGRGSCSASPKAPKSTSRNARAAGAARRGAADLAMSRRTRSCSGPRPRPCRATRCRRRSSTRRPTYITPPAWQWTGALYRRQRGLRLGPLVAPTARAGRPYPWAPPGLI